VPFRGSRPNLPRRTSGGFDPRPRFRGNLRSRGKRSQALRNPGKVAAGLLRASEPGSLPGGLGIADERFPWDLKASALPPLALSLVFGSSWRLC
jgi:hypothetical protein